LGIAILGAGRIAESAFVPAARAVDGARIVAVLSRDEARGDAFAERNGIDRAYTDLGALLADPGVDAVIVASPDALHEPQAVAAARAGKHILCEKPMATTHAGCERMAEAVRAAGVTFMMGYSNRFNSGTRQIKELMEAGDIGAVRCARALLTTPQRDPGAWRAQPGTARYWAMSASGTHVIDLYRWYFGEPERVGGALSSPVHHGANDEIATFVLAYPGLMAEFTVAAILPAGNRLELHGEEGAIIGENVFGRPASQTITCNGEAIELAPADSFRAEVAEFVAAIAEAREPAITIRDGMENVRIMERVREGRTMVEL
jgi:1,5-anhydro-D-fructose reductase (1,5-anhydro-D-mannitol-forming)